MNEYIEARKIVEQINWLEHDITITKQKIKEHKGNEYQIIRLKAFVTKSEEMIRRLKNILENS